MGAVLSPVLSACSIISSLRSGKSVDRRPGDSGNDNHEVRLVYRGPERRPKDARVRVVVVARWSWCGCGVDEQQGPWGHGLMSEEADTARAGRKSRPGRWLIGK